MTRFHACLVALALPVAAAHGQKPPPLPTLPEPYDPANPPVQFKPFNGVSPEQFRKSSADQWARRLANELDDVKAAAAGARLPAPAQRAVAAQVDQARQALARQPLNLADLDRQVRDVAGAVQHAAPTDRAMGAAVAEVQYAFQQLQSALSTPDAGPDRVREAAVRLAENLHEQAIELRYTAQEKVPDPELPRALRDVARAADRVQHAAEENDLADARRRLEGVTAAWRAAAARLNAVRDLPPAVRAQAVRVDGLYRKLADLLGQPPAPALAPPRQPPPPQPQVGPPAAQPGPRRVPVFAVGAGETGAPRVLVYQGLNPQPAFSFFAYDENNRGGVRVAVADLNGDGVSDIVTAPGKDLPPLVRVFDGRDMSLLVEFLGFDQNWRGGVNVAAADLSRNGQALVAVGADVGGGPNVRLFDLAQGKEVGSFFAFDPNLRCGVRVALTDVNGDGTPDVLAAPGPGSPGPVVRVFDGTNAQKVLGEVSLGDPNYRGGLFVAAAADGPNGRPVAAVAADAGGGPPVHLFDLTSGKRVRTVTPYPDEFTGGVRVALADLDGDGVADVVTAPGAGVPAITGVFRGRDGRKIGEVDPFQGFRGGAFVGGR